MKDGLKKDLLWLALIFGVLYLGMSWTRPLANPDEGRYSVIPMEMLLSGDWVTPRLNGVLYFYKPPLFYWMQASAMAVGGDSLFFLRFWPGVLSLMGIFGTYLAGRRLYGRTAGWCSACVLGTSLLYFGLGQIIILDMAVSVFMALALFLFYFGLHEEGRARKWFFWTFYLFIALAVLSKGFMGLLIPGAVIFLWFLLLNQWKRLRKLYLISGSLLFLVVALPWHVAVHLRNPEWFDFYVIQEHFLRYLSDVSDRYEPFWYFFVIMPLGLLPWAVFLPQALRDAYAGSWKLRKERSAIWFLGLTALFILLFFSASNSKLIPYILPAYPSLAIIVGRYLGKLLEAPQNFRVRGLLWGFAAFAIVVAFAVPIAAWARAGKMGPDALPWFTAVMGLMLAAALATIKMLREGDLRRGLLVVFAGSYGFLLIFNPLASVVQRPSTQPYAKLLLQHLQPDDEIYTFQDYYQDFPFYLKRPVGVAENLPNEQSYGIEWEPEQAARYPRQREVAERWGGSTRIFGMSKPDHAWQFADQVRLHGEGHVYFWMSSPDYILFSNQAPPENITETLSTLN